MKPAQKVLTTVLWGLTVLAMVGMIGAGLWKGRGSADVEDRLPMLGEVPAFSLTNQNGQTVTLDALKGKTWIVDYVFTSCAGPCPTMTNKMRELQKSLPPEINLVSITVDPNTDTPQVLKQYAGKFSADESRWHFLTGKWEAIDALARGMMVTALPAHDGQPIVHDEHFLLISSDGNIRGFYSSGDSKEMDNLKLDAGTLAAEVSR